MLLAWKLRRIDGEDCSWQAAGTVAGTPGKQRPVKRKQDGNLNVHSTQRLFGDPVSAQG